MATQLALSGITKLLLPGHHDREINGEQRRRARKIHFETTVCSSNVFGGSLAYFMRSENNVDDLEALQEARRLADDQILRKLMYHGTVHICNTSILVPTQQEENQALIMPDVLLNLFNKYTSSDVYAFHFKDGTSGGDGTTILLRATFHWERPAPTEKLKKPKVTYEIVKDKKLIHAPTGLLKLMMILEVCLGAGVEQYQPYLEQTMTMFSQQSRFVDHPEHLLATIPLMTPSMDAFAGHDIQEAEDFCSYAAHTRAKSHKKLKKAEKKARQKGETLKWDKISIKDVEKMQ